MLCPGIISRTSWTIGNARCLPQCPRGSGGQLGSAGAGRPPAWPCRVPFAPQTPRCCQGNAGIQHGSDLSGHRRHAGTRGTGTAWSGRCLRCPAAPNQPTGKGSDMDEPEFHTCPTLPVEDGHEVGAGGCCVPLEDVRFPIPVLLDGSFRSCGIRRWTHPLGMGMKRELPRHSGIEEDPRGTFFCLETPHRAVAPSLDPTGAPSPSPRPGTDGSTQRTWSSPSCFQAAGMPSHRSHSRVSGRAEPLGTSLVAVTTIPSAPNSPPTPRPPALPIPMENQARLPSQRLPFGKPSRPEPSCGICSRAFLLFLLPGTALLNLAHPTARLLLWDPLSTAPSKLPTFSKEWSTFGPIL